MDWLERDETVTAGADDFPARRRRLAPALMPWDPRTKWRDRSEPAAGFRSKMLDAVHGLHLIVPKHASARAPTSSMLRPDE